MSKKGRRIFGLFGLAFGSIFLLIGLAVMGAGIRRGLKQRATEAWPKIEGEIISMQTGMTGKDGPSSTVTYRFDLAGKIYRSSRIAYIDRQNIEYNDWLQLANGLPDSGRVTVYYDPRDPGESVLISGNAKQSWSGIGTGALFAGFAAVWMTFWWVMSNWLPNRLERETIQSGGDVGAADK